MKLTEHFQLSEFTRSATADRRHIDNSIPTDLIPNLKNLCEQVLETLRQRVGEPVIISSGYRCSQLNAAVGGSKTSQHMKGEACDIYLKDQRKLLEWFAHLTNGEFDQLILERSSTSSLHYWIHVSCKPDLSKNRHIVIQGMVKE